MHVLIIILHLNINIIVSELEIWKTCVVLPGVSIVFAEVVVDWVVVEPVPFDGGRLEIVETRVM